MSLTWKMGAELGLPGLKGSWDCPVLQQGSLMPAAVGPTVLSSVRLSLALAVGSVSPGMHLPCIPLSPSTHIVCVRLEVGMSGSLGLLLSEWLWLWLSPPSCL